MARKKTKSRKPIWEHFGTAITETEISVQSGMNYEIKDRRYRFGDSPVYRFRKYISFHAVVIWPDEQVGEDVEFSIYTMSQDKADQTLSDLHLKNKYHVRNK